MTFYSKVDLLSFSDSLKWDKYLILSDWKSPIYAAAWGQRISKSDKGMCYKIAITLAPWLFVHWKFVVHEKNYSPNCLAGEDEGKSGYFQCGVHLLVDKWNWHRNFLNLCIRGFLMLIINHRWVHIGTLYSLLPAPTLLLTRTTCDGISLIDYFGTDCCSNPTIVLVNGKSHTLPVWYIHKLLSFGAWTSKAPHF